MDRGKDSGELTTGTGHGRGRLIDAHGEQSLAVRARSNREATVAQTVREAEAASDRKLRIHSAS